MPTSCVHNPRYSPWTSSRTPLLLAGSAASFVVQGCDAAGLPVVDVGLLAPQLSISIAGPAATTHAAESLADGTVRVWYTPIVSGRFMLRVNVRSKPLPGSPFEVLVAALPSPSAAPRSKRQPGGSKSPRKPRLSAADVELVIPEGLVAYNTAGQRGRISLRAPHGGYLRPGDAARFKCVRETSGIRPHPCTSIRTRVARCCGDPTFTSDPTLNSDPAAA